MNLIREIQENIENQKKLWEEQAQEILEWFEEESKKPTVGLKEWGERAAQARAGEREWVAGMERDKPRAVRPGEAQKPIFLMGKQLPPSAVTLTGDGRALVRAKGRTFEYRAEDQGDRVVLK